MTSERPQRAPEGLSEAGRRLWKSIAGVYELDPAEYYLLAAAARQADDVAHLEAAVADDGVMVAGSAGQPRLNPALVELRQGRLAVARLLGQISLPAEDERALTEPQRRASRAASARWDRPAPARGRPEGGPPPSATWVVNAARR